MFDSAGQVPVGDYAPAEDEFIRCFVAIDDTSRRETVYAGWKMHGQALQNAGLPKDARQLLNGSYTSSKSHPSDIDIAVEIRIAGDFATFCTDNTEIFELLKGPKAKPSYNCDAYPIPILLESDPDYKTVTEAAVLYWTKWFGKDRAGNDKGRIWALAGEHP